MLFKNREHFPLNKSEKIIRAILRALLLIIFLAIGKGCFNQSNTINEDIILVPIVSTARELFCLLYIINAFTTGNLVRRWANDEIRNWIYIFIQYKKQCSNKKATLITTKAFGLFAVLILCATITAELNFYFW